MANGYSTRDLVLNGASVSCAQSSTTAVTAPFRISDEDSKNTLVRVTVSAITVGTAISAVLQDSPDGSTWSTVDSASLSATTNYELELNIFDGSSSAMWPLARVVVTTGSGDTATISSVLVTRRL